MGVATFRWILQKHKNVPKAAKFYSEGLGFTINVCTLRWAQLQSGSLNLALLHSPRSFLVFLLLSFFCYIKIVHLYPIDSCF